MLDNRVKPSSNQIVQNIPTTSERTVVIWSTTTEKELSFLDLLLGEDGEEERIALNTTDSLTTQTLTNGVEIQPKTTEYNLEQRTTISGTLSLPENESSTEDSDKIDSTKTNENQATDVTSTTSEDINTTFGSTTQFESATSSEGTKIIPNENVSTSDALSTTTDSVDISTVQTEGTTDGTSSTASSTISNSQTDVKAQEVLATSIASSESISDLTFTAKPTTGLAATSPVVSSTNSFEQDLQELLSHSSRPKPNKTSSNRPKRPLRPQIRIPETTESSRPNATNNNKATTENIFSALFGGISNIFSDTNSTTGNVNRYKIRVNNDTNGSGTRLPTPFSKRTTTTGKPDQHAEAKNVTFSPATTISTSTPSPIVINSNPSILESELSYDYGEPTLPPSLPNLNIIPFLPTDAVKTNRNHGSFGFLQTNATSFPTSFDTSAYSVQNYPKHSTHTDDLTKESKSSADDQNDFELFQVGAQMSGEAPDRVYHLPAGEDGYHPHSYPSITEPSFDANDQREALFPNFSKYGSNNYHHYGGFATPEHRNNDYDSIKATSDSNADAAAYGIVTGYEPFASGDFAQESLSDGVEFKTSNVANSNNNQFSPPSETEGKSLLKKRTLWYYK